MTLDTNSFLWTMNCWRKRKLQLMLQKSGFVDTKKKCHSINCWIFWTINIVQYTPEDLHGTQKSPNSEGTSSSKPSCLGSMLIFQGVPSLKLTYPLKIDGCKMKFLLGRPIFRGYSMLVSGCISQGSTQTTPSRRNPIQLWTPQRLSPPSP